MVPNKKNLDPLLSTLAEIKKDTSTPEEKSAALSDRGGEVKSTRNTRTGGSTGDLLSSLLSEVQRDAEQERQKKEQEARKAEENARRAKEEEEKRRREEYQRMVEEEAQRRKGLVDKKVRRAREAEEAERKKVEDAIQAVANQKAREEAEKRRKKQRLINMGIAAVVIAGIATALLITKPWESTEPLQSVLGQDQEKKEEVASKVEFTPMYDASDRGDPSIRETDENLTTDIPPLQELAWLAQSENRKVEVRRSLGQILAANDVGVEDASYKDNLSKRFDILARSERKSGGGSRGNGSSGGNNGLQLDLSAFGQKNKK